MKTILPLARVTWPKTAARHLRTASAARLLPLLLLALPTAVQAQFNYTTNDGTITITGYSGSGGAVTIPSTITGLPVTSIDNRAFEESGLTSVTIPSSVTSIGMAAFNWCSSLANVTIGNGVTSIGWSAFCHCTSLTNVIVGDSVTNIGSGAFAACTSLTTITIPNRVITIEDGAFQDCTSLTSVTLPSSVTDVGWGGSTAAPA